MIQHVHKITEKRTNPQTYPQGYPQIQWITFKKGLTGEHLIRQLSRETLKNNELPL